VVFILLVFANHIKQQVYEQSSIDSAFYKGQFEGRAEQARLMAQYLSKKGMSIEDICEMTGLPEQQITP